LPLGTAVCYAGYLIVTRRLTTSSQPVQMHFFTSVTCMAILSVPLALGAGSDLAPIARSCRRRRNGLLWR
jgi:drug/metabolite transporter (DMT)-like permease